MCLRKDGSLWRIGGGAYGSVRKTLIIARLSFRLDREAFFGAAQQSESLVLRLAVRNLFSGVLRCTDSYFQQYSVVLNFQSQVYKAVRQLTGGRKQFVAVKVIAVDASEQHRQDFEKEVRHVSVVVLIVPSCNERSPNAACSMTCPGCPAVSCAVDGML